MAVTVTWNDATRVDQPESTFDQAVKVVQATPRDAYRLIGADDKLIAIIPDFNVRSLVIGE